MITEFQPYNLDFHGVRLPEIDISSEDKKRLELPETADNFTYLTHLCYHGFEKKLQTGKINPRDSQIYADRCKTELETFKKLNLTDYILLVYEVLNWCAEQKIPKGPGRGSAAGSLVLFLIGCTYIDPIKHSLYFTRFISEARTQSKEVDGIVYLSGRTLADIDNDVGYYRRGEVLKFVEERFKGKTSKIGTQSCLTGKSLIKEVSKVVLEYSEEEARGLANLIEKHFGIIESLENTYKKIPEFKTWVDKSPANLECYNIACSLQDIIKNKSLHASGIALSFENIEDFLPLELSSSKDVTTSYNMEEVANLVVKLDILGLKTIDVIDEACKVLGLEMFDININDPSIYHFLSNRNEFYGLFQIEEGLSKKVILDVKPRTIDHLSACIAISRPGALAYIKDYVKFVNEGIIEPFHPRFDAALKDTGNIIIYQEQITKICEEVYKIDAISSDQVRYCVGKKKREEIAKWEDVVKKHGKKEGIPEEVTQKFWDTINKSADYLFCYNHSLSYSYITAITAYLKANHPQQFFLSLLKMAKFEPNPIEVISKINQELRHFGITLLPPHILYSDIDFKIEGNDIRFGLGSVKGISEKTIEKLNNFRHPHSNKFEIFTGAKEAGLSIGVLSALIAVGSLDIKGERRSKIVYEAQVFNLLTINEKKLILQFGPQFNFDLVKCLKHVLSLKNEKGKPLIKESRYETLKKHAEPYKKMYEYNNKHEKLNTWYSEKLLLGYAYSVTLIEIYKSVAPDIITIEEVNSSLEGERVHFVGEATEVISRRGKESGRKYIKALIQDHTSSTWVLLCDTKKDDNVAAHQEDNGKIVKEGDLVSINGSRGNDIVFARKIGVLEKPIMQKVSEIPPETAPS